MKSGAKEKLLKDIQPPNKNAYVINYNKEAYRNLTKAKYHMTWSHGGAKSQGTKARRRGYLKPERNVFPEESPGVVSSPGSAKRAADSPHRATVKLKPKQRNKPSAVTQGISGLNLMELSTSNTSFIFPNTTKGYSNSSDGDVSQVALETAHTTPYTTSGYLDPMGSGILSFTTPLIALFIFGILAIGVCIARRLTDKREKNFYYTINDDVKTDDSYLQGEGNFEMGPYGIDYDV